MNRQCIIKSFHCDTDRNYDARPVKIRDVVHHGLNRRKIPIWAENEVASYRFNSPSSRSPWLQHSSKITSREQEKMLLAKLFRTPTRTWEHEGWWIKAPRQISPKIKIAIGIWEDPVRDTAFCDYHRDYKVSYSHLMSPLALIPSNLRNIILWSDLPRSITISSNYLT